MIKLYKLFKFIENFLEILTYIFVYYKLLFYSEARIIKANLSWSRTQAIFCELIASLPVFKSFLFCAESRT